MPKAQDAVGETRNFIYDVDNDCVIIVGAPQSDDSRKQRLIVDVFIPERLCEEPSNGMQNEV